MSPKCGRQVPEQPDGPSVSLPRQVQQRLRSALSDHGAVGVDADSTASWQGVQCGGLRLRRVRGVPLAGEALGFDPSFRQRLDVLACPRCGGRLTLIALIEDPAVIVRVLGHLGLPTDIPEAQPDRAPPLHLIGDAPPTAVAGDQILFNEPA